MKLLNTSNNMSINEDYCIENNNIRSTGVSVIEPIMIPLDELQEMLLETVRPIFDPNYEIQNFRYLKWLKELRKHIPKT